MAWRYLLGELLRYPNLKLILLARRLKLNHLLSEPAAA